MTEKLSLPQFRVLRNLATGLSADCGLCGRSQYGGHVSVLAALYRRGLIDRNDRITEKGLAVFEKVK